MARPDRQKTPDTVGRAITPTRSGPGRPKKMGPDSVLQIKDAALHLFAQKGYTNTSLDDIAASVGLTKGGIYYYFRSKERLLLDILDDIEMRSIGETGRLMQIDDTSSLSKLMIFTDKQASWAGSHPSDLAILMLLSIETVHNKGGKVGERVRAIYQKMEALLSETIDQGKQSGEFSIGLPTCDIVLPLMAIHDGNMLLWYRSGCHAETGRTLAAIMKKTLLKRILTMTPESLHSHVKAA